MRLSIEEVALLKSTLHTLDAELYLLASRVDDIKYGRYIDLYSVYTYMANKYRG